MQLPAIGEIFRGKYRIDAQLGRGGFAVVYRAVDVEIARDVVIKLLTPGPNGYDEVIASRFEREAKVLGNLHHRSTITMFEFGRTDDGLLFMVFEFVDGEDLSVLLKRTGPLPPTVVEHVMRQLLGSLREAHDNGVLHRDIKPANIIIFEYMDDPWSVKLIDFGIAKGMPKSAGGRRDPTQLTRAGAVIGTPRYMPPEALFGEPLVAASDLYSVGLVAYEMLVGRQAIAGQSSQEVVRAATSMDPILVPDVPNAQGLARVISRMVGREVEDRYPTATAVLTALDSAARFTADQTAPESAPHSAPLQSSVVRHSARPRTDHPPAETHQRTRSRRRSAAAVGVLIGACIGAALFIATVDRTPEPSRTPTIRQVPPAIVQPPRPAVAKTPAPARSEDAGHDDGATADASTPRTADGCGKAVFRSGFFTRKLVVGHAEREYTVYVPANYNSGTRHRVMLMAHKALWTGHDVIAMTKMDRLADRENLILVGPRALSSTRPWSSSRDVELTVAALQEVRREYCTDPQWLYAVGHGGGGGYVSRLHCAMPLSAAASTADGERVTDEICSAQPTPYIRIYGLADRHVPYKGGAGCEGGASFRSAQAIADHWREHNHCEGSAKKWRKRGKSSCSVWTRCDAAFASCGVEGGHDWPTAPAKIEFPGCGGPPMKFALADTIWEFFEQHAQPLDPSQAAEH